MLKINYNATVKVKLDDNGKAMFRKHYGFNPVIDKDGFSELVLWQLIGAFGPYIRAGTSFAEDGCIYMNEKDLEEGI